MDTCQRGHADLVT